MSGAFNPLANALPNTLSKVSSTVASLVARLAVDSASTTTTTGAFKVIPKLPAAPRTTSASLKGWSKKQTPAKGQK